MPSAMQFAQSLINGIGTGLIYGLVGMGFSVIYNASGIINFAQGAFVMLGGMVTYGFLVVLGLPLMVAAALAIVLVALVGLLLEVLVMRPMLLRQAPLFTIILATLAIETIIERLTVLVAGGLPAPTTTSPPATR